MNTNKDNTVYARTKHNVRKAKLDKIIENTPEHIRDLAYVIKNNAEIRRYTALGIINKLRQTGYINKDAKVFVKFYFNKYAIIINGLKQEFTYNNNLFITCLAAAFPSFAHNANKIINNFLNIENQEINDSDIQEMVEIIKDNTSSPVEEDVTNTPTE